MYKPIALPPKKTFFLQLPIVSYNYNYSHVQELETFRHKSQNDPDFDFLVVTHVSLIILKMI